MVSPQFGENGPVLISLRRDRRQSELPRPGSYYNVPEKPYEYVPLYGSLLPEMLGVFMRPDGELDTLPDTEDDVEMNYSVRHEEYAKKEDRLKTFADWPISIIPTKYEMAEAGFFYFGKGDLVKCFSCGGCLRDWLSEDIALEEHAFQFDYCSYLQMMVGKEGIKKLKEQRAIKETAIFNERLIHKNLRHEAKIDELKMKMKHDKLKNKDWVNEKKEYLKNYFLEKNEFQQKTNEEDPGNIPDYLVCQICLIKPREAVIKPCYHLNSCLNCLFHLQQKSCPTCRQPIKSVHKVFL